ncbi:MAG: glycosyltransferase family 1 protein [Cytophagia bacterium]|nr:glycosyltransferase family 1 protein [Cytophagia bacterium]
MKPILIRVTTIPASLNKLLEGQLKFMNKYFDVIAVSSDDKELYLVAKKENVKIYPLNMTRKITPFKDFISLIKMYYLFKKIKPIIVHTHTPKAGIIGMCASYFASVPVRLHTIAGMPLLESKGLKKKLLIFIEKLTYFFSNQVYCNSKNLMATLINQNMISRDRIKVISHGSSNGIDLKVFNPNTISLKVKNKLKLKLKIKKNDFVFIYVGRIVKDKGINELIYSFKSLLKEFKSIKLLLIGPFEDNLDPIDKKHKNYIFNNKNIIYLGYKDDVRPYLSISNLFVFPSYREGFPNALLQASAMGLPCIATNINGCNEIIYDNYNGSLINSKSKKLLYSKMRKYLIDKDYYKKMKLNTYKTIKDKFDRKDFLKKLLKEYNFNLKKKNIYL